MAHHSNKRRRSDYSTEYADDLETVIGTGSWVDRDGSTWAQQPATGHSIWQRPDEDDVLSSLTEYAHRTQLASTPYATQPDSVTTTTVITSPSTNFHLDPNAPTFTPQGSSPQPYHLGGYAATLPASFTEPSLNHLTNGWPTPTTFVDFPTLYTPWLQETSLPDYPQHDLPPPLDSSNFDLPPGFANSWNPPSWLQPQYPALTPPPSSHRAPSMPRASMQHISQMLGQLPTPTSTDRMLGEAHTVEDPNRVAGQLPPSFLPDTPTPSGPRKAPPSQSGSHSCTHTEGTKCCNKAFETQAELKKHQQSHRSAEDRPFKCLDCDANFNYQKDLDRHYDTKSHRRLAQDKHVRQFLCPVQRCARHESGFTRKDNFRRHLQSMHPDLGEVEPIVVRISPAPSGAFSFPPPG